MKTELPDNELSFESEAAEQDQSIDQLLAYLWWLIQQYYWVLLPISLLSLGGAYFWTQQQPRIFRASSKIVVYPDQSNILGKNIDPTGFMGRQALPVRKILEYAKRGADISALPREGHESHGSVGKPRFPKSH